MAETAFRLGALLCALSRPRRCQTRRTRRSRTCDGQLFAVSDSEPRMANCDKAASLPSTRGRAAGIGPHAARGLTKLRPIFRTGMSVAVRNGAILAGEKGPAVRLRYEPG